MKKRIGVTGASGFIGKLLIQQLLHEGYPVTALVRSKTNFSSVVKIVQGDLTNAKIVDQFLQDVDILIHLAGRQTPPEKNFFQDNVIATNELLNRAKNFPLKHLIFLSSVVVYGDQENKIHKETDECHPTTYYGMTKYLAEKLCEYWQINTRKKLTILRPFNVYGKGSTKGVVSSMIENAKKTKTITIYGNGNQARDFLYVDDLINAILIVIKKNKEGIFNLGIGKNVTIHELANKIKELSSDEITIVYKPNEEGKTKKIVYSLKNAHTVLDWKAAASFDSGLKNIL